MFYKDDCLHGIVHIRGRTAPSEGLCFFWLVQIMDTAEKRKGHGKLTSYRLPCPCKSSLVCARAKKRRLWISQSRRFISAWKCVCCTTVFSFAVVRQVDNKLFFFLRIIIKFKYYTNIRGNVTFDRKTPWIVTRLWHFNMFCENDSGAYCAFPAIITQFIIPIYSSKQRPLS